MTGHFRAIALLVLLAVASSMARADESGELVPAPSLSPPVAGPNVELTSGFGPRLNPILRRVGMHTGIDWTASAGRFPVLAAADGKVEATERNGRYGLQVRLAHEHGVVTTYSHLTGVDPELVPGRSVRKGQTIGYFGEPDPGSARRVLHFEVLIDGRFVDPAQFLAAP